MSVDVFAPRRQVYAVYGASEKFKRNELLQWNAKPKTRIGKLCKPINSVNCCVCVCVSNCEH